MARTVNPEVHAVRRETFVDAAQRLMQVDGYARMSLQDVLDATGASRGAFYHYFGSKEALLEAVIDRMADGVLLTARPVLDDPAIAAPEKLRRLFGDIARFKAERRDLVLAFIEVWLSDDNAIVRERFRRRVVPLLAPLFEDIIRQGALEGSFNVEHPAETARVLVSLILGAQETATELYAARVANTATFEEVSRTLGAFNDAFDRVLGAGPGSTPLGDEAILREWYG